jgi:hypothetical protein
MADALLLDGILPHYDATRIEHRVIDGAVASVYEAALRTDFLRTWRESTALRALIAARTSAERLVAMARNRPYAEPETPATLRLSDLTTHGTWVRLGERPPDEIVFGVVGRFWSGETSWEEIDAADFAGFDRPGFAKIACNLSLRPYGEARTLVSYEARTQATSEDARRAFLRYWTAVTAGVGIVMRTHLQAIEREAAAPPGPDG